MSDQGQKPGQHRFTKQRNRVETKALLTARRKLIEHRDVLRAQGVKSPRHSA